MGKPLHKINNYKKGKKSNPKRKFVNVKKL